MAQIGHSKTLRLSLFYLPLSTTHHTYTYTDEEASPGGARGQVAGRGRNAQRKNPECLTIAINQEEGWEKEGGTCTKGKNTNNHKERERKQWRGSEECV
jgi:hypothetical protein